MQYLKNDQLTTLKANHPGNLYLNGRFLNYTKVNAPKLKDILRWKINKNPQLKEKSSDQFRLKTYENQQIFSRDLAKIVWLGHASFLITLNGKNILLDPVFADIPLVKRRAKIPFTIGDYTTIDYILISHAHYDHMDKKTLCHLASLNPNLKIYCGLKMAELLHKWKIKTKIVEAGWYQQFPLEDDQIEFSFMPALHWANRTLRDRNKRLWGSFVVRGREAAIYFMGDSGYSGHFAEIGQLCPGIDYALLGVGAYMPRNIMQYSHINPEEAVQAYYDLQAHYMLPMHYATYDLTDEPYEEPIRKTVELFSQVPDKLLRSEIGNIINLGQR